MNRLLALFFAIVVSGVPLCAEEHEEARLDELRERQEIFLDRLAGLQERVVDLDGLHAQIELLREWIAKLGPYIRSCHAKDILLQEKLTVHLDEVCPGAGYLDYGTYLQELTKVDPDTPLMLEHMHKEEDYLAGASYIRSVAKQTGVSL